MKKKRSLKKIKVCQLRWNRHLWNSFQWSIYIINLVDKIQIMLLDSPTASAPQFLWRLTPFISFVQAGIFFQASFSLSHRRSLIHSSQILLSSIQSHLNVYFLWFSDFYKNIFTNELVLRIVTSTIYRVYLGNLT